MMKGHVFMAVIIFLAALPLVLALVLRHSSVQFIRVTTWIGGGILAFAVVGTALGYRMTENLTGSLPGHVYVYKIGETFQKGDLVAFLWHGGATYPRGTIFIKQVVGVPGDVVTSDDRDFWVAGHHVGKAKTHTKAGVPVEPAQTGVIAKDEYFVATPSPDSLDSRYALTGNIPAQSILGRAHELF